MKLIAQDLYKSFGEKHVLNGISFSVESGQSLGILGRNGAGKTTTIRILMQVFPADSGSVTVDGHPLDRNKVKIGYLPEERGMYPRKKIMEQLIYFGALRGVRASQARATATRLLEKLGMTEHANKKLDTLSKGNQQKIQLVATLINDPDIVILDEPFSGLDPVNAMLLEDIVKELITNGKIVLFSSHQMNYIEEFCDNIIILSHGNVVLSGNIREIKHSYDRSRIVLSGSDLDAIAHYTAENLGNLVARSEKQDGCVLVTLKDASLKSELISAMSRSGLDLDEFRVYEPSLGDIFVEYTEDSI